MVTLRDANAVAVADIIVSLYEKSTTGELPRTPQNLISAIKYLCEELLDLEPEEDAGAILGSGTFIKRPQFTAAMVMQLLPHDGPTRLTNEQKLFWMQFAETLGPDWIQSWRKVGAFMDKVESF